MSTFCQCGHIYKEVVIIKLDILKETYTPHEVGDMLSLSKTTIYKYLKSGEIASIKIGREYVIPKQYIENYLEKSYNDRYLVGVLPKKEG